MLRFIVRSTASTIRSGASVATTLPCRRRRAVAAGGWLSNRRELSVDLAALRAARKTEVDALAEVQQHIKFERALADGQCRTAEYCEMFGTQEAAGVTNQQLMDVIRAGFATSLLHKESRIASLLGQGFYTIGMIRDDDNDIRDDSSNNNNKR